MSLERQIFYESPDKGFSGNGSESSSSLAKVASADRKSPILEAAPSSNDPEANTYGLLGKTGVVVTKNGTINTAVRSPLHIPDQNGNGYGGPQREKHVETSLAQPPDYSVEGRAQSRALLLKLKYAKNIKELNGDNNGKAFYVGPETEGVMHTATGGIDHGYVGQELTLGQAEFPQAPVAGPLEYAVMQSDLTLRLDQEGLRFVETSAPVSGRCSDLEVNNKHPEYGIYIDAIQAKLLEMLDPDFDSDAWEVWDQIAQNEGYEDMQEVFRENATLAPWFQNALHMSVGAEHVRQQNRNVVRLEHLIGTGDLISSALGAPLAHITASTPLMFGVEPTIRGRKLKDVRLDGRHLLPTSGPNTAPILTPYEFLARNIEGIVCGHTHTIDRASYHTVHNGKKFAVMHGQARIRHATSTVGENEPTGRVEATGMGATPSLPDQAASLGYLQILKTLAVEADSQGMTAVEYADQILGLRSVRNFNIRTLNSNFNRSVQDSEVDRSHSDALRLINYMNENYRALAEPASVARAGLMRIRGKSASTFNDYLEHPRGSFSDVVRAEYKRRQSPETLVQQIHEFQLIQADKIQLLHKSGNLLTYLSSY